MKKSILYVSDHPYKTEITSFGRDEMVGLLFNTLGTVVLNFFLQHATGISGLVRKVLLSIGGPIVEKLGFFIPHLCMEVYKQLHTKHFSLRKILKRTIHGGGETLLKDVLLHDPLYIFFMFVLQIITPETPILLISFISFIIALLLVGFITIIFNEGRYKLFTWRLQQKGFQYFTYYESRIYIPSFQEAEKMFHKLMQYFHISEQQTREYNDTYYDALHMQDIGGRTGKVRLRVRSNTSQSVASGQLVFTKAKELRLSQLDQYRYFPIKKDKYIYYHDDISHIENTLHSYKKPETHRHISFSRLIAQGEKGLLITLDSLRRGNNNAYMIEVKVDKDVHLLKDAIRFILRETAGEQHTHGKDDF